MSRPNISGSRWWSTNLRTTVGSMRGLGRRRSRPHPKRYVRLSVNGFATPAIGSHFGAVSQEGRATHGNYRSKLGSFCSAASFFLAPRSSVDAPASGLGGSGSSTATVPWTSLLSGGLLDGPAVTSFMPAGFEFDLGHAFQKVPAIEPSVVDEQRDDRLCFGRKGREVRLIP